MTTALELVKSFGRRKPNQEEVAELHRLREQEVEALSKKDVITVEDIQALEWGAKFEVANKFFDKCEPSAQHALLHDQHHGVRAAAQLFKPETVLPAPAPAPESAAHMTVAEAARTIMNGKQRMATLHGVKTVAGIEDLIASTYPRDVLQRAERFIVGFEGDDMQEGVDQLLADLRAALKPIR